MRLVGSVVAWLALSGIVLGQSSDRKLKKLPENVVVETDVEYGRVGDRALVLDLVQPDERSDKPLPVVAFIHGGGWRNGSKASGLLPVALLASTGNYVGVTIEYRLTGEAIWPAQINDCKAAIRWIRANASKYNIDPNKIGVWGNSAGGHLVSMLGTTGDVSKLEGQSGSAGYSSRVNCVVDFCGPSDLLLESEEAPKRVLDPESSVSKLLGGPITERREVAIEASPARYATSDDPPFFVVHGTKDPLVPLAQAEHMVQALERAGVPVTFSRIEGGGHGIRGPEITARVQQFFDKNLRGQSVEISQEPIVVAPE
ncbi:MAG TPA: alpha/beta hydrolase [Pirellulales bacterium]|nr:alpha/beta hydrolase [Pirellulales bacterium]